ncbi:MAG: hypothetical protein RL398_901 [Planctomycetota bacterium]|jgi:REP element-mobilizing transposase RayT
MFESGSDMDRFLELLGGAVDQGWIEVHSYAILTTHFHALIRVPETGLSLAMRHCQLGYSRGFNRQRRRDGPLWRGRFLAKKVKSIEYRRLLVGYIDANPVAAGLASIASEYPYGSCCAFVHECGPAWLSRAWVADEIRLAIARKEFRGADYPRAFGRGFAKFGAELVRRRIRLGPPPSDPTDDLLEGRGPRVLEWMRYKAEVADGTGIGAVLASPSAVDGVILNWQVAPVVDRQAARAILLRRLCGATLSEIAQRLRTSESSARRVVVAAARRFSDDPQFAEQVAVLGHTALAACYRGEFP